MLTRSDVVDVVYRSLRDAITEIQYVFREKNNVVFILDNKKVTVSFRVKIEENDNASPENETLL
jgi:hypothetical protein